MLLSMPKTIVITGASDGIGASAARRLHQDGHRVAVVGRSPQKTQAVARELGADAYVADFTKLADVRALAAELDAAYPAIDVLANNAGGIFGDTTKTEDGFEMTFQINHLAPFLLTQLLLDKLIASRASVIQTASVAARMVGKLDMSDLEHDRDFTGLKAYGTAKLENILFTKELQWRYGDRGIAAVAFHPGNVATSFGSTATGWMRHMTGNPIARAFYISPEKAAERLVWLAEGTPGTDWQPGEYYEKNKPARTNPQAGDAELARKLWERSEALLAATVATA
jgi:NAD(P)-dependent dehydrogenase (short-subunit alcohol dehydrogenase family)